MEFETFVILVAVVVIVLIATASTRRRGLPVRMCRSCGAPHPSFAQFCRRCGQRLL